MKVRLLLGVIATLAFGSVTQAGTIGPALKDVLTNKQHPGDVPVIVKFADALDLKTFRQEVERTLAARYPDAKVRKVIGKGVKRSMIVASLKEKAKRSTRRVRDYLASRGQARELTSLWAINAVAVDVPADLVGGLATLPGVESVVLDATLQGPDTGTAPTAPTYWNLDTTGAPALWQLGHTGLGVVVATLDTGVDASHPDLGPRWRGGSNSWFDPYGEHTTPTDSNGHGTQVLGLIVAGAAGGYQVGMAPDAKWIAAKIFDDANQATLSGVHAAFQWVLDPDGDLGTDDAPDIVNNSWDLSSSVNKCVQEFAPDIALLKEAEIAVVFAGGNYGPDAQTSVSPGNDPVVVSVGAVEYSTLVDQASSRGANACDGGVYPDLVAPGDGVLTTDRMPAFYTIVSGTSFAVAHLAGGMALLRSTYPESTVSQLESALVGTATDLGAQGPDNDYGHGLIDVVAAHDWLEAELGGGGDPGTLQLSAASYGVAENVASLTVTVTRVGGSTGGVTIDYATADGLARAGEDYMHTSGTLTFLDGETSRTVSVAILDDSVYEGDEDLVVGLSNPQGGAALGMPQTATVTILEDDPEPGPADSDGDGFTADVDCDDANASIYPSAQEIKHDGIDQDCNGYDLTIEITLAWYLASKDRFTVYATSDLGSQAGLSVTVTLASGRTLTQGLSWNASQGRWQLAVNNFVARYGSVPLAIAVWGIEGSVSRTVEQRR